MTLLSPERTLLCEDLLAACGTRAATYDRENRFFTEDVAALRDAGHLRLAVSPEPGGFGRNLADVCADQRRLGDWAAPTVLCVNMHLINTGVVTDVGRFGDTTQEWLLKGSGRVRAGPFHPANPSADEVIGTSDARARRPGAPMVNNDDRSIHMTKRGGYEPARAD